MEKTFSFTSSAIFEPKNIYAYDESLLKKWVFRDVLDKNRHRKKGKGLQIAVLELKKKHFEVTFFPFCTLIKTLFSGKKDADTHSR